MSLGSTDMTDAENRWRDKLGFMQGRLSPKVDGKIQAFPWDAWRSEFAAAAALDIRLMEWTLDQDRLYENPLLTPEGQAEIRALTAQHGVRVGSLTGDCFMQAPFWKESGEARAALQRDFMAIAKACAAVGIVHIVVPLVDNGGMATSAQEDDVVGFLTEQASQFRTLGVKIVFECDYAPVELARFIGRLEPGLFGINYDIGNSASLGFNPVEEFTAYGPRILNVHVKDRVLGGTTVPLGTGNARFPVVFEALARQHYQGDYILQTARAGGDDHAVVLGKYRDMVLGWLGAGAAVA
jgi:L-ribulose-5-phosphate 3-epimerase